MLNIPLELEKYSINNANGVVIGSGILNALKLRESKDIDVVVNEDTFNRLSKNLIFEKRVKYGIDTLKGELIEIFRAWPIVDIKKTYSFNELYAESVVLENIRYIKPEFLLKIKQIFSSGFEKKQKDLEDIKLIEEYLKVGTV